MGGETGGSNEPLQALADAIGEGRHIAVVVCHLRPDAAGLGRRAVLA